MKSVRRLFQLTVFFLIFGCSTKPESDVSIPDKTQNYSEVVLSVLTEKILHDPDIISNLGLLKPKVDFRRWDNCNRFTDFDFYIQPNYSTKDTTRVFLSWSEDFLDTLNGDIYLPAEGVLIREKRHLEVLPVSNPEFEKSLFTICSKFRNMNTAQFDSDFKITLYIPIQSANTIYQRLDLSPDSNLRRISIRIALDRKSMVLKDYGVVFH